MFKKLINKLMSNEEIKNDVASEENTKGAVDPERSAPEQENPVSINKEEPVPSTEVPAGNQVPAGHQVPGTDMSTGITSQPETKEPVADEVTGTETVPTDEAKVDPTDPMVPVGSN